MIDNFYINCNSDGNKRVISRNHPIKDYWVYYSDNHPVKGKLIPGEDKVFDYAYGEFFAIREGVKCWDGTPMKVLENFQVV